MAQQSLIPVPRQILMTPRGKIVKYQTLFIEHEIFIYDRSLFAPPSRSSTSLYTLAPFPEPLQIDDPPDTLSDDGSLDAWKTLFVQRREWARHIVKEASARIVNTTQHEEEISVIMRATAIATQRVSSNSGGLQSSIQEAQKWSAGVLLEPGLVLQNWDRTLKQLSSIKADPALLRFLQVPGDSTALAESYQGETTFENLVSKPDANRAASRGKQAMKWLEGQLNELESEYHALTHDSSKLVNDFKAEEPGSGGRVAETAEDLSEEMQAVLHKIDTDCDHALNAQGGARSLAAVSKSALMHTQNLLPSLMETMADIDQLIRKTVERKNQATKIAVSYLQRVSAVESTFADLKAAVGRLEISDDDDRTALDTLTFIHQLPTLYGSLLIESVRRSEWTQKMTQDSSTLQEEMAVHRDDEERRRKRWSKTLEHYLNPSLIESKAVGIEVNLNSQGSSWPKTSRADIQKYLSVLERIEGLEPPLQQLREQIKTLDAPSKQQARRSNAFKNGSIHEAAYGRNSLLLRGDDDLIQTLQTEKSRLEDRLKGSESRIRKLEDLLHRQSQITRPSGGSPRASLDRQPSSSGVPHVSLSPRGDTLQYRPSPASSRRVSQTNTADEKAFVQRILHLEGELEAERSKVLEAQQFAAEQKKAHEVLQQQIREAASLKQDLMDNFEAQQTEFDGERRLLSDDNRHLKIRVEELEEELDRLSGSYDNRDNLTDKNKALESEIERLRKEASNEFETLQSLIKSLQNEQREKNNLFQAQENLHHEEKRKIQTELSTVQDDIQAFKGEREEHQKTLYAIHRELSKQDSSPSDFAGLVSALDSTARRAVSHAQELQVALDSAKAEHAASTAQSTDRDEEISQLREQLKVSKEHNERLQGDLDGEKDRFGALKSELEEERTELYKLRSRLTDGESGSEALQARLTDEERKVEELGQQIATSNNRVQQLQHQLSKAHGVCSRLEETHHGWEQLLRDKTERAEEISQLLFLQTNRLTHLLEHCGFSVTRQDEAMVIQRVSRSGAAGKESLLLGPSQSIDRTASGPMTTLLPSDPPAYIHWALAGDPTTEAEQFSAFHRESKAFDLDAFGDAIVKRIKDIEHIARKWQREAKNYRDRFHRAQFESQHKIAFRTFREGDLALFLPTRNQAPQRSWAAFNVGAPHYFLREEESHRLNNRDWLLARISKVEERVVDLSKQRHRPLSQRLLSAVPGNAMEATDDDNPFSLSDGLRWYFLDAAEEKVGAPSTPGMGTTTVASAHVDAEGSIPRKDRPDDANVARTLAKSLDSRRSSGNSRKSLVGTGGGVAVGADALGAGLKGVGHVDGSDAIAVESGIATDLQNRGDLTAGDVRADQLLGP